MSNKRTSLSELEKQGVIFKDGDWVESKDQNINGEIRLIQLADIGDCFFRDRSRKYLTSRKADELKCTFLKKNDILVARMPDPLGRACLFPFAEEKKYVTVVDVAIIRVDSKEIIPKFLMYYINSPVIRQQIVALQSGTTRRRISRKKLGCISFHFPDIETQARIVARLESLYDRMEDGECLLREVQKQTKYCKQSILNSAIRGKLVPQDPNDEPASELLKRIKAEKEALVKAKKIRKEKPLPPIDPDEVPFDLPDGWEWVCLRDMVVGGPTNGLYLPKDRYGSGTPIVRIDDFQDDWCRPKSQLKRVSADGNEKRKFLLKKGDLVVNRVNSMTHLGKSYIVSNELSSCLFESNMMRLSLSKHVSPSYVKLWLDHPAGRKMLVKNAKQAVNQASLNQQDVLGVLVPLPPLGRQDRIVENIARYQSIILKNLDDVKSLSESSELLKMSVLKSAFEGRLQ